MIEIFTLTLKPGTGAPFQQLYIQDALPLLIKWNFNVLAYGLSLHDENSFYVIRAFKSLKERQKSEDSYYNSRDLQEGPRTALPAIVQHYSTLVISPESLNAWSKHFKEVNE